MDNPWLLAPPRPGSVPTYTRPPMPSPWHLAWAIPVGMILFVWVCFSEPRFFGVKRENCAAMSSDLLVVDKCLVWTERR